MEKKVERILWRRKFSNISSVLTLLVADGKAEFSFAFGMDFN